MGIFDYGYIFSVPRFSESCNECMVKNGLLGFELHFGLDFFLEKIPPSRGLQLILSYLDAHEAFGCARVCRSFASTVETLNAEEFLQRIRPKTWNGILVDIVADFGFGEVGFVSFLKMGEIHEREVTKTEKSR